MTTNLLTTDHFPMTLRRFVQPRQPIDFLGFFARRRIHISINITLFRQQVLAIGNGNMNMIISVRFVRRTFWRNRIVLRKRFFLRPCFSFPMDYSTQTTVILDLLPGHTNITIDPNQGVTAFHGSGIFLATLRVNVLVLTDGMVVVRFYEGFSTVFLT